MPARPQAWISVMPFGTSCSLLSMMSLGTLLAFLFGASILATFGGTGGSL